MINMKKGIEKVYTGTDHIKKLEAKNHLYSTLKAARAENKFFDNCEKILRVYDTDDKFYGYSLTAYVY